MNPFSKATVTAFLMTTIVTIAVVPAVLAPVSIESRPIRLKPVYANLRSEIDTVSPSTTPLVSVNFTIPFPDDASIFFSVGTFIRPFQCCQGSYLELISVDNGPLGAGQGLGCGGQTSQFTGTLLGVSCFGRLSFTAGTHSATLWLLNAGGGIFTVEQGPSTAILTQFD